ncbi:hypothetical protein B0H19DRAFT_1058726 [Mycena capillaripes]|nr:hypothetical protein B0H19DRAFT_1058726 [Mycena capillaripes]
MELDAVPDLPFNRFTTIGALEIGILIALFFSGLLTVQVLLYFQRYWHDSWRLKLAVFIEYGRPDLLIIPPRSLSVSLLLSGFIGPLEQGWFTYRLHKLTKRSALPLFCMLLAIARFVGLIGLSTIALRGYPLPEYDKRVGWLIEAVVIVSAILDALLMSALCYYLSSWRLDKSRVNRSSYDVRTISDIRDDAKHPQLWSAGSLDYVFANSLLLSLNSRDRFAEIIRGANGTNTRPPTSMCKLPSTQQIAQLEMTRFPSSPHADADNFLGIRSGVSDFHGDRKSRVRFSGMESPGYGAGEGHQSPSKLWLILSADVLQAGNRLINEWERLRNASRGSSSCSGRPKLFWRPELSRADMHASNTNGG